MNELQRQLYLSALGVDTYMPRWQLAFAPASVACSLPAFSESSILNTEKTSSVQIISSLISPQLDQQQSENKIVSINSLIGDIFDTKKIIKTDAQIKQSVSSLTEVAAVSTIEAFSLSIWRPIDDLMIVDSRNTKLALPTDALLKNLFRNMFSQVSALFKEEVLRCPMIENSFAKRTADDARAELQTWLSVQCEIRPIKYLWLMGENATNYLVADIAAKNKNLWQSSLVADSNIPALILPSLNELLINPLLKKPLFSAIRRYHS